MKDLTGQRFGRLVAIEPTDKRKNQLVVRRCRCDCGRECEVVGSLLTKGNTRSCGCLQREVASRDIAGERFGRLVAIAPTDKRVRQSVVWSCRCDCGNTREVPLSLLRSGQVRSCGCLRCEATENGNQPRDLVGERFGRLVVRKRVGSRNRSPLWRCRCDCGNVIEATSRELRSGQARSCGCLPRGHEDLAGHRFGKLMAVNPDGVLDDGVLVWRCLCDCGNVCRCTEAELASSAVTACSNCGAET